MLHLWLFYKARTYYSNKCFWEIRGLQPNIFLPKPNILSLAVSGYGLCSAVVSRMTPIFARHRLCILDTFCLTGR